MMEVDRDGRKWMAKVHAYPIEQRYDVIMESALLAHHVLVLRRGNYRPTGRNNWIVWRPSSHRLKRGSGS